MPDVSLGLAGAFSHGRVISELAALGGTAAGDDLTYTVDGAYWERPVSLSFVVATLGGDDVSDVTVSYLDGGGVEVLTVETGPAISPSGAAFYSLMASWTGAAAWSNDIVNAALPPLLLQPSWSIVVHPSGDTDGVLIQDVRFYRERFITGDQGYQIGFQDDEGRREYLLSVLADHLA